jgi:hypothetical protein
MVPFHLESDAAEARAIVEALRTLHANPQLADEVQSDPSAFLDRMCISGVARHAIAATLALSVSGVLLVPGTPVFWGA